MLKQRPARAPLSAGLGSRCECDACATDATTTQPRVSGCGWDHEVREIAQAKAWGEPAPGYLTRRCQAPTSWGVNADRPARCHAGNPPRGPPGWLVAPRPQPKPFLVAAHARRSSPEGVRPHHSIPPAVVVSATRMLRKSAQKLGALGARTFASGNTKVTLFPGESIYRVNCGMCWPIRPGIALEACGSPPKKSDEMHPFSP